MVRVVWVFFPQKKKMKMKIPKQNVWKSGENTSSSFQEGEEINSVSHFLEN